MNAIIPASFAKHIDNQIEASRLRYQELLANTPVKVQSTSVIARTAHAGFNGGDSISP
jgi:hypothetical protein